MRHVTAIFLCFFLLMTKTVLSQRKCDFPIDTAKILANQNLEFFLNELKSKSFKITNNKKDIPKIIKKQLDYYVHRFRISNPDEPYNATDLIVGRLPRRQLTFLAKSSELFLMQYNMGGRALTPHLLLVKYNGNKIVDMWKGISSLKINSIEDAVNYLELNRTKEWGLNTNIIYF